MREIEFELLDDPRKELLELKSNSSHMCKEHSVSNGEAPDKEIVSDNDGEQIHETPDSRRKNLFIHIDHSAIQEASMNREEEEEVKGPSIGIVQPNLNHPEVPSSKASPKKSQGKNSIDRNDSSSLQSSYDKFIDYSIDDQCSEGIHQINVPEPHNFKTIQFSSEKWKDRVNNQQAEVPKQP